MRRNAALFVAISLLSGFGSTAMSLVAGISILDLTGSSGLAGLAGLCVYAPTVIAPWLGTLVDRLPRRPLVIAVDLLLSAVLLTLLTVHSRAGTWLIFAVMLGYGISYVLLDAGESALLPAALPAGALGDVNGWRSSAQEGMKLVGPLAGAAVYSWRGGGSVAVVSATTPFVVAGLYALVRLNPPAPDAPGTVPATPPTRTSPPSHSPAPPPAPSASPAPSVAGTGSANAVGDGPLAGPALFWRQPAIRVPVLVASVSIAMSGFTTPAIYAVVTRRLGLPSTFIGVLTSVQGAGSIAGGLIAGRLIARFRPTLVAAVGAALFAVACLCRCLPGPAAQVVASLCTGVGLPWTLIAGVTAVQTHTPDALLGRAAAAAGTAMFGPNALAIPLGAAAVHLGGVPPYLMAAAVCLGTAIIAFRRRSGQSGTAPAHPAVPVPDGRPGTAPRAVRSPSDSP
jgi:MFS family permease